MKVNFEITKFIGMHSQPEKIRGGEQFAADIKNLRIDENGWLQNRAPIADITPGILPITGLALSNEYLFVLRSNGGLSIRHRTDLKEETNVSGVDGVINAGYASALESHIGAQSLPIPDRNVHETDPLRWGPPGTFTAIYSYPQFTEYGTHSYTESAVLRKATGGNGNILYSLEEEDRDTHRSVAHFSWDFDWRGGSRAMTFKIIWDTSPGAHPDYNDELINIRFTYKAYDSDSVTLTATARFIFGVILI